MRVNLSYGQGHLPIELLAERTTVIEPAQVAGLPNEHEAVIAALERPIGSRPLLELINPKSQICIVFTDLTRATPNERIIPWLLHHLKNVDPSRIILLNSGGTHRPNTREELEKKLTPAVVQ